ncbi:ATP-dependent DNA helicase RecG [Candidatus Omnitrophota bacterium]
MKDISISARFIKGVGPSKLKLLNRLGIETVEDLLYCLPRRYEDRSNIKKISDLKSGNFETTKAKVLTFGDRITKRGLNIFQMAVGDSTGVIHATWFNQPYMKDKFKVGLELILYGKVEKHMYLQINNPEYEILTGTKEDSIHMGRIVPIYPLTESLNQRWFRNVLKFTLDNYVDSAKDILPYNIRTRNDLMLLKGAIQNVHFPVSQIVLKKARRRLIFDEFLLLQIGIALKRASVKIDSNGYSHAIEGLLIDEFKGRLPFELTNSQKKVLREIEEDMKNPKPMSRLLQGDVGSGKTVVALYALILAIQNKSQGALMVPTEILAGQHYQNIQSLLSGMGVRLVLLSGDLKPDERQRRRHMIEEGTVDLVIGTHSLIQEGVCFKNLGLAIIDEQHKFGVMQRSLLKSKSLNPDVLVMTATPIPRTLALTVYGDLDVSVIDELPPGRKSIKTLYFEGKNRKKAYAIMAEQAKIGRQAYVVYPLIEDSETSDLRAATRMHKELSAMFPDLKIGLLHGRLKSIDKEKIMRDFKNRKIEVLVSTIVVEVGLDIPNASLMVIEHADRFGLSGLHQLRGRIGRGKFISYCILIADPKNDEAKKRINALLGTQDGFKIAEEDLEIRGPGEFFGTRQHGLPELKIGNIIRDRNILETAKTEAFKIVEKDRYLLRPENRRIRENLNRKFKDKDLELSTVG